MSRQIQRRAMLVAMLFLGIVACADRRPLPTGPLFVLLEQDPWAMVLGGDSPAFALYGDGTVIYRKGEGYRTVKLERRELTEFMADLDLSALSASAKHYQAVSFTDARSEVMFVFGAGKPSVISVYGPLTALGVRTQVPAEVVSAYDRVRAFDHPKSRPWLPDKIEVMIWPYDYAPEASVIWPKEWPSLDDANTVQRSSEAYSIYLPAAEYPALKRFLATQRERGAVEIGNKKWAASTRFPFPGEASWMANALGVTP